MLAGAERDPRSHPDLGRSLAEVLADDPSGRSRAHAPVGDERPRDPADRSPGSAGGPARWPGALGRPEVGGAQGPRGRTHQGGGRADRHRRPQTPGAGSDRGAPGGAEERRPPQGGAERGPGGRVRDELPGPILLVLPRAGPDHPAPADLRGSLGGLAQHPSGGRRAGAEGDRRQSRCQGRGAL